MTHHQPANHSPTPPTTRHTPHTIHHTHHAHPKHPPHHTPNPHPTPSSNPPPTHTRRRPPPCPPPSDTCYEPYLFPAGLGAELQSALSKVVKDQVALSLKEHLHHPRPLKSSTSGSYAPGGSRRMRQTEAHQQEIRDERAELRQTDSMTIRANPMDA